MMSRECWKPSPGWFSNRVRILPDRTGSIGPAKSDDSLTLIGRLGRFLQAGQKNAGLFATALRVHPDDFMGIGLQIFGQAATRVVPYLLGGREFKLIVFAAAQGKIFGPFCRIIASRPDYLGVLAPGLQRGLNLADGDGPLKHHGLAAGDAIVSGLTAVDDPRIAGADAILLPPHHCRGFLASAIDNRQGQDPGIYRKS
jgi:hypothetical protein